MRGGLNGPGRQRSGGGTLLTFEPHGTDRLVGQMLAMRAYLPLEGAAGGLPGATTELLLHRADGRTERVTTAPAGVELLAGERFEIRCASGGGVGDPLDPDPLLVVADVTGGLFGSEAAKATYGVVLRPDGTLDAPATTATGRRPAPAVAPSPAGGPPASR